MTDRKTSNFFVLMYIGALIVSGCTTPTTARMEAPITQQSKSPALMQADFELFAAQRQMPPFIIYTYDDRMEIVVETNEHRIAVERDAQPFLSKNPAAIVQLETFPQFTG